MTTYNNLDRRSDMDARRASDVRLSDRILAEFGLKRGDIVVLEEITRRERRVYLGEVLFAWVTRHGGINVTFAGRSGWAPGSATFPLVDRSKQECAYGGAGWGISLLRHASGADRVALRSGLHEWRANA
jgi:hypothetical protein